MMFRWAVSLPRRPRVIQKHKKSVPRKGFGPATPVFMQPEAVEPAESLH